MKKYSKIFDKKDLIFPIKQDKFPDPRNWKHQIVGSVIDIPKSIDLRKYMSPVKYQGALGSCSAFGTIAMIEYYLNKNKPLDNELWDLSEMFQYYYCRALRGQEGLNVGAYVIDAIKTPLKEGYTTEDYCPYIIKNFTTRPGILANISSRIFSLWKPKGYYNIPVVHEYIRDVLIQGYPIGFGMSITENFQSYKGGVYNTQSGKSLGGHFMVICGYDNEKHAYLVKNSWGSGWGSGGYCWIGYNLINKMFDLYYYK